MLESRMQKLRAVSTPEGWILIVALINSLCVLALVVFSSAGLSNPLDSRAFNGGDSEQYILLAQNIVEHGAFSLRGAAPYVPDVIRTPGYPTFLAILYLLAGRQHSPILIITAQLLLSLLNIWLVMLIGKKLFTPSISRLAGLLYAMSPAALIFSGVVMSETLFATFLLLSLLTLIRIPDVQDRRRWGYALLSGMFFALGAYTRPIGLYAIPIPMLALVFQLGLNRRSLGLALAMLIAFVGLLAPWYARNYFHYQSFLFTSLANKNLLFYNVGSIEAQRQGISWSSAKDQLWLEAQEQLDELNLSNPNEAQISQVMGEIASQHIFANPLSALLYQTTDMVNSLRPGYSMAMLLLRDKASEFGREIQIGNMGVIGAAALHEIILFGLMTAYYAVLYASIVVGIIVLLWRRQWNILTICGLIPFWFLYQPGIAGNARFRAPVEGLLALVAAFGLIWIWQRVSLFRAGQIHTHELRV